MAQPISPRFSEGSGFSAEKHPASQLDLADFSPSSPIKAMQLAIVRSMTQFTYKAAPKNHENTRRRGLVKGLTHKGVETKELTNLFDSNKDNLP